MLVPIPLTFMDIPVYGNRDPFPSYYATADQTIDGMQGPLIVLHTSSIRPMMRASRGRYMRTRNAWNAWRTLAHEYTHSQGHQHPGFSSEQFDTLTLRNLRDILSRAGVPRSYSRWVLKRAKRDFDQTTYVHPGQVNRGRQ